MCMCLVICTVSAVQTLLDRLEKLNSKAIDLDVTLLDKKIDQMMPELGFKQADNDRLVASFSGGWQMRMCLGKLLLQVSPVCGLLGGGAGSCACTSASCCCCRWVSWEWGHAHGLRVGWGRQWVGKEGRGRGGYWQMLMCCRKLLLQVDCRCCQHR
jgi:hypothetical protein